MSDLLPLALRAIDDPDALPVLGDAVLDSGWWDQTVVWLMAGSISLPKNYRRFRAHAARPTAEWARAVAAYLLFVDWPTKAFPVVERERRKMIDALYASMRTAWQASGISEMVYNESPILGMIQKEIDATRASIERQHGSLLFAPPTPSSRLAGIQWLHERNYITRPQALDMIDIAFPDAEKESDGT